MIVEGAAKGGEKPMAQSYTFRMDSEGKLTDIQTQHPDFAQEIAAFVNESKSIHNKVECAAFLEGVTSIVARHSSELVVPNPRFEEEMKLLPNDELNIVVPAWGGVAPQVVDKKKAIREKYLIIQQAINVPGVLGPEYHEKKDEYLIVEEGFVLWMSSEPEAWEKGEATWSFAGPGDEVTLHPGNRHGIIAITNALVLEKANNTLKDDILPAFQ